MINPIDYLKNKAAVNYNSKSFLVDTEKALEIIDEMKRKDNLIAVYEILIDKAQPAVSCNDCPFVETCINKDNRTDDCQFKMLDHIKSLGVDI